MANLTKQLKSVFKKGKETKRTFVFVEEEDSFISGTIYI